MTRVTTQRRLQLILFVVAALILSLAAPAIAARGGDKGKATPTLSVTPMAATSSLARDGSMPNGEMVVGGDGYQREAPILVKFYPMDTGYLTDADGRSFSFEWMPPGPGTYTLVSYQLTKRAGWAKAAETTITVNE